MIRYLYGDQLAKYPRLARTMFEDRADQFKTRLGGDVPAGVETLKKGGVASPEP